MLPFGAQPGDVRPEPKRDDDDAEGEEARRAREVGGRLRDAVEEAWAGGTALGRVSGRHEHVIPRNGYGPCSGSGYDLAVSPKAARGDATPFLPERRNLKALRE